MKPSCSAEQKNDDLVVRQVFKLSPNCVLYFPGCARTPGHGDFVLRRIGKDILRDYELMWILPGATSDEDGEKSVEAVSSLITENGGEIKSAALWGRRTLSYPIKKNSEGAYYLARFSIDASATPALSRAMEADQGILRHLIVKDEPKKVAAAES